MNGNYIYTNRTLLVFARRKKDSDFWGPTSTRTARIEIQRCLDFQHRLENYPAAKKGIYKVVKVNSEKFQNNFNLKLDFKNAKLPKHVPYRNFDSTYLIPIIK